MEAEPGGADGGGWGGDGGGGGWAGLGGLRHQNTDALASGVAGRVYRTLFHGLTVSKRAA